MEDFRKQAVEHFGVVSGQGACRGHAKYRPRLTASQLGSLGKHGQPLAQYSQAGGLEQAIIHAGAQATFTFLGLRIGRVAQDGAGFHSASLFMVPDGPGQVIAIHQWHAAVDNDHIEAAIAPEIQAFLAILRGGVRQLQVVQLL
ncbi:hypothetical protein D3C86_1393280 [compost metagenome]